MSFINTPTDVVKWLFDVPTTPTSTQRSDNDPDLTTAQPVPTSPQRSDNDPITPTTELVVYTSI